MRAILIDPTNQTVTEVEHSGHYKAIQHIIDARCFDCVRLGDEEEHTIYVDDEGLLNGKVREAGMFRYDGDNPAYLAGKGLILATDREGDSVAATMTLDEVKSKVSFGVIAIFGGVTVFAEFANGLPTGRAWPLR